MPPASRLVHNWRLKLLALGLSLFLWAVVQAEPSNRETFTSVPVRVEVADTGWVLSEAPNPSSVEIQLGGVTREIIRLAREGTTLRVPIAQVGSSDTVVSLRREWVEAGQRAGITVESVFPPTVDLRFERAANRLVPVAPRFLGALEEGLALAGDILPNPQFVRVRGPESRVLGLDSVTLVPLDLGTVDHAGTFTVAVDTVGLSGASVLPSTVALTVRAEDLVDRVLFDVPVRVDGTASPGTVAIDPSVVEVRLRGARSLVGSVDPGLLTVSFDPVLVANLLPGEAREVPLGVVGAPAGVRAVPIPELVTVRRLTLTPGVAQPAGPRLQPSRPGRGAAGAGRAAS